jgi:hypothetical protein
MRYHLHDPSLGGVIALRMVWEDGRMVKATVEENETGSTEEAAALIEVIRRWAVEGLDGTFTIPFRITMVGSDDPDFHRLAIVTGTVRDRAKIPLSGATITFTSVGSGAGGVPDGRTNREGIFIRSLIPAGEWTVRCAAPGYRAAIREGVSLESGEHRVLSFVLEPE